MNDHNYDISNEPNGQNPAAGIDGGLFLKCVHCGMCTSACPTYTELGDENDGPRGRIQLMQLVADGRAGLTDRMRRHLDLCLDCRSCETACPSGVEYGRMIEPFRLAVQQADRRVEQRFDWFRELILLRLFPHAERLRRLLGPVRFLQRVGMLAAAERLGLLKLLPGRLERMVSLLPPPRKPDPRLPKFLPSVGRKRARVALFVGCVGDAMFRHVHWATVRVLQRNGCDVFVPPAQGCCGAIHFHAGNDLGARQMADRNLVAFELDRYDAIVVNHAGCGAMMKEYGQHWQDGLQPHREKFAAKVRDIHEFLDELGTVPPGGRIEAVATYHDACHLGHAQKITQPPRRLLAKIPGLELRDLPETEICCGSAGIYNLNEAEMSDRLSCRKMENILSTGAQIVLAANAGCLLQIMREVRHGSHPLEVMHPMQLLDRSYRGEAVR
ncbi:MAG: (Fe-S)-binding protein [Candidatus Nealsonbacteria bacterium]|nr:(Fe-S)-binding protein [Candidatus Nealsonbacteria bacterium]